MKSALFLVASMICTIYASPFPTNDTFFTGDIQMTQTGQGSLFYWLFKSRDGNQNAPLIIWLQGGPGFSSMFGLLYENGPFLLPMNENQNPTPFYNNYSWNAHSDVMWVDQPVGVGFSDINKKDILNLWKLKFGMKESDIAKNFYEFLEKFIQDHPEYAERDLFVTGESYAGHYIPVICSYIAKQKKESNSTKINLKGAAIGNGLITPSLQYPAYTTFAYQNKLIGKIEKVITGAGFGICKDLIKINMWWPIKLISCYLNYGIIKFLRFHQFNTYDIRESKNYDYSYLNTYLNLEEVQKALNVSKKYVDDSTFVFLSLWHDLAVDYDEEVGYLLDNGYEVLLYHGDQDFMCNWIGGLDAANHFEWAGKEAFNKASMTPVVIANATYGEEKEYQNLKFLKIHNAGHMVPYNQPMFSLYFIEKWMNLI